jgi:hypothetical protein
MSTCLCLPQLREQVEQRSGDFGIARLGGRRCVQFLTSHVSAMGRRHFTPSLRSPSPHSAGTHPPSTTQLYLLRYTNIAFPIQKEAVK